MLHDAFTARERCIFKFQDGRGERRADPLTIEERLLQSLTEIDHEAMNQHLQSAEPKVAFNALAKLLPAIREAFGVTSFDDDPESGLTREELLDLLAAFWDWRDTVKKNSAPTVSTSPPSGDGTASGSVTKHSSASGGTASGSRRSRRSKRSGGKSRRETGSPITT